MHPPNHVVESGEACAHLGVPSLEDLQFENFPHRYHGPIITTMPVIRQTLWSRLSPWPSLAEREIPFRVGLALKGLGVLTPGLRTSPDVSGDRPQANRVTNRVRSLCKR